LTYRDGSVSEIKSFRRWWPHRRLMARDARRRAPHHEGL